MGKKGPLVGFLGSCGTPYCGGIEGYFCVLCRHYVAECRCQGADGCTCEGDDYGQYWASTGERPFMRYKLLRFPRGLKVEKQEVSDDLAM